MSDDPKKPTLAKGETSVNAAFTHEGPGMTNVNEPLPDGLHGVRIDPDSEIGQLSLSIAKELARVSILVLHAYDHSAKSGEGGEPLPTNINEVGCKAMQVLANLAAAGIAQLMLASGTNLSEAGCDQIGAIVSVSLKRYVEDFKLSEAEAKAQTATKH